MQVLAQACAPGHIDVLISWLAAKTEQGQALGMLGAYSAVLIASSLPPTRPTRVHVLALHA